MILFDRPGFGYSERPRGRLWTPRAQARLIARALDWLQADAAILYGHSLGAQVAAEIALTTPSRVRALVLGAGYTPTPRPDVPAFVPLAVPGIGDVLRHLIAPLVMAPLMRRIYASSSRRRFPSGSAATSRLGWSCAPGICAPPRPTPPS